MSFSFTNSETQSFTVTHAKYIASKVAADLKRIQRFYNSPPDSSITDFESELVELLKSGYLKTVTYGFKKDGNWIVPTLTYTAKDLQGMNSDDDDPGRVSPNANTVGASFYSFLVYSSKYFEASPNERKDFEARLPFSRTSATEPGVSGYMSSDKTYSSGGRSLERSTLKNH